MSFYSVIRGLVERLGRRSGLLNIKTHTVYTPTINPNSIVIDLGANVGDFVTEMHRQFGCRCLALEAVPTVYDQIPAKPGLEKYNLAISASDGPVRIFTSTNRECHSIFQSIAESYVLDGTIECQGITLESFLASHGLTDVDIVKVDIEGAESHLFRSTGDATLARIGQLTIEFHDFIPSSISSGEVAEICRRLKKLGFRRVPMSYLFPDASTCDFLFINRNKIALPLGHRVGLMFIGWLLWLQYVKAKWRGTR